MKVVYPGSFDPPTNGHLDVILRASKLFTKVIVVVLNNNDKNSMFSAKERFNMLQEISINMENVEIMKFDGLLVDFCKKVNSNVIIRGIRAFKDFEYEFQMALTNKTLNDKIETLFIHTDTKNVWISSSIVKEIAKLGGEYCSMVPNVVKFKIQEKLEGL